MIKILHYYHYPPTKRLGGPSTYLYNLREEEKVSEDFLVKNFFYENELPVKTSDSSFFDFVKKKVENIFPVFFKNLRILKFCIRFKMKNLQKMNLFSLISKYDIIHFHDAYELSMLEPYLVDCNKIIVLTSHTPKARYLELIEDGEKMDKTQLLKPILRNLIMMEMRAYEIADYVITPCKEALEPYYNSLPNFEEFIKTKKVFFCPTGIENADDNTYYKDDVRTELGIPNDAFCLCFAGRQIEVKGYDILTKFGSRILEEYPNVYFIILGKGTNDFPMNHERWIKIGWSDNPQKYIKSSDLFILPNRQTFFDLVFLEVMSLGIPILASETGGNKYFKNTFPDLTDIQYYDYNNYEIFRDKIVDFMSNKRITPSQELKNIFEQNFTKSIFHKKINDIYKNIVINH